MKKKTTKKLQSFLLLAVSAAVLTVLGCQKVETTREKNVSEQALATTYQTEIQEQLELITLGETEPTRQVYEISDLNGPAPLPNPAAFGEVQTPEELQELMEKAEAVLEGQELYFSTDIELFPDSTVHYYLDDTIFAITWKQKVENTAFTFAEVKVMHPSQFRRYLSGEEFGSGMLSLTSEMTQSVNAVLGCSGDYYSYRRRGLTIVDGEAKKYVKGRPSLWYHAAVPQR